jgi:hypothetical protein
MRIAIIAAFGLFACGCGTDERPTGPTPSTVEHLVIVRVLNAESGRPLTNLTVTLVDGPLAGITSTSPSDQVPLQLPTGQMTLRIEARGFHPVDRAIRVNAPMIVEVRADPIPPAPAPMPTSYGFFGIIRDGIGNPVPGVRFRVASWRDTLGADDRTGRYQFDQPSPAPVVVYFDPPQGYDKTYAYVSGRGITLPGPGEHNITIRRIVSVDLQNTPATMRHDGVFHSWQSLGLRCPVVMDTGERFDAMTTDGGHFDTTGPLKREGSGSEFGFIQGFVTTGTGEARIQCGYWFVYSRWVPVQVIR